jgi:hypothetical protein
MQSYPHRSAHVVSVTYLDAAVWLPPSPVRAFRVPPPPLLPPCSTTGPAVQPLSSYTLAHVHAIISACSLACNHALHVAEVVWGVADAESARAAPPAGVRRPPARCRV